LVTRTIELVDTEAGDGARYVFRLHDGAGCDAITAAYERTRQLLQVTDDHKAHDRLMVTAVTLLIVRRIVGVSDGEVGTPAGSGGEKERPEFN
jgi:hypothetical protein